MTRLLSKHFLLCLQVDIKSYLLLSIFSSFMPCNISSFSNTNCIFHCKLCQCSLFHILSLGLLYLPSFYYIIICRLASGIFMPSIAYAHYVIIVSLLLLPFSLCGANRKFSSPSLSLCKQ